MKRARMAALVCVLVWSAPSSGPMSAASTCRPTVRVMVPLSGRVDSLVAADPAGPIAALVAQPGSRARFLPHDNLVVSGPSFGLRHTLLPPYLVAPGLAARSDGTRLYVVVDSALLTIDGASGRLIARQDLAAQAIGWPAAITADSRGVIDLIAQPAGAWADQVEALRPDRRDVLRPLWHNSLGLTHAGAWLGLAGLGLLAVYTPDQQDLHGTLALLKQDTGALVGSYALPGPPITADAPADRIYLAAGGAIRAYALRSGSSISTVGGAVPMAASGGLGLVAFVRQGHIVVANAASLRVVRQVEFPSGAQPTAMAWQGTSLLMGDQHGVNRIGLKGCGL